MEGGRGSVRMGNVSDYLIESDKGRKTEKVPEFQIGINYILVILLRTLYFDLIKAIHIYFILSDS